MTGGYFQHSIRLTPIELQDLMERIEQAEDCSPGRGRRRKERRSLRRLDLRLVVKQPGGSIGHFLVPTRDVNPSGLGFLHGGYLHPGTRCLFDITKPDGSRGIAGSVMSCSLYERGVHLVGVKFDEEVDPACFTELANPPAYEADPEHSAGPLAHALLMSSQRLDTDLLQFTLRGSGIATECIDELAPAIEKLKAGTTDLVVLAGGFGATPKEAVLRIIRRGIYTGPILALTADPPEARFERLREAGASVVLNKPCPKEQLLVVLSSMLSESRRSKGAAPKIPPQQSDSPDALVYSKLEGSSDAAPVIARFVKQMHQSADLLGAAARADRRDEVRSICRTIKSSAAGYGFDALSVAASAAMSAAEQQSEKLEALAELRELESLCRRATTGSIAA